MSFILFINKDTNHTNNALSDILANTLKEPKKLILSHFFCRSFFVHSIQQPQVPDNTYCLKMIITLVDSFRALNITKLIRWMITLLIFLVILMLSQKDNFFYHRRAKLYPPTAHSLRILLWTGPILDFKGSVQHVQKGHPTLVMQVELILQN